MDALPLRRIVMYAVAAAVVLAVGAWVVAGGGAAEGEPVEIGLGARQGAAGGAQAPIDGSGPSQGAGIGADPRPAPPGAAGPAGSTTTTLPPVFVQVAGEVHRPGVYEVPAGSRVFEVLARAGGVTAAGDEQALPLAAVVSDGARIVVPAEHASGAPGVGGGVDQSSGLGVPGDPAAGGAGGPMSLATATVEQLDTLPGVGPSLAGRIVAYRDAHGPFASVSALDDVPGIGPATVAKLEGLVVP